MKTYGSLLLCGVLAGSLAACGDSTSTPTDAGTTPTDTGSTPTDTGSMADAGACLIAMGTTPGACPTGAVTPMNAMAPSFRLTQIEITAPAALASPVVGGIINPALGAGTFLWGITFNTAMNTFRSGALNINMLTRGTAGRGLFDGTFRYYNNDAPMAAGMNNAWDPVSGMTTTAMGAISGTQIMGTVRIPIFTPNATNPAAFDLLTTLPLSNPRFHDIRVSMDNKCIGGARFTSGRFNECSSSQWCTRTGCTADGMPSGVVEADISVMAAQNIRLTTLPGMPTLCTFISGSDCSMGMPASWMRPPDAMVDGMPAYHLVANFAAVSANISNAM